MRPLERAIALICCIAVLAAACSGSDAPAVDGALDATPVPDESVAAEAVTPTATPEPVPDNAIKIGVLLDTGSRDVDVQDPGNIMSPLDLPPAVALQAEVEALNEAGGLLERPLALVAVDSTSRLSVIDKASADMIADGVDLLVVTCELDFAQPALARAAEAEVLVMSPCASEPEWASGEAGSLAFSMVPGPDVYGRAMAEYAWDQGLRRLAVFSDVTAPDARVECGALADRWVELGGRLGFSEAFGLRSAEALRENPGMEGIDRADAVALCAFPTIGLELIVGLRQMAVDLPILASPSLDSGTWLPIDVADASDGSADLGDFRMFTLASVWGDDPSPLVAEAIDGYQALQATIPSSGRFVVGADLAAVWASAVERAGTTDAVAVARELEAMSDVETVSGRLSFAGAQAPASRELRVMRHDNGSLVFETLVTATR